MKWINVGFLKFIFSFFFLLEKLAGSLNMGRNPGPQYLWTGPPSNTWARPRAVHVYKPRKRQMGPTTPVGPMLAWTSPTRNSFAFYPFHVSDAHPSSPENAVPSRLVYGDLSTPLSPPLQLISSPRHRHRLASLACRGAASNLVVVVVG